MNKILAIILVIGLVAAVSVPAQAKPTWAVVVVDKNTGLIYVEPYDGGDYDSAWDEASEKCEDAGGQQCQPLGILRLESPLSK